MSKQMENSWRTFAAFSKMSKNNIFFENFRGYKSTVDFLMSNRNIHQYESKIFELSRNGRRTTYCRIIVEQFYQRKVPKRLTEKIKLKQTNSTEDINESKIKINKNINEPATEHLGKRRVIGHT